MAVSVVRDHSVGATRLVCAPAVTGSPGSSISTGTSIADHRLPAANRWLNWFAFDLATRRRRARRGNRTVFICGQDPKERPLVETGAGTSAWHLCLEPLTDEQNGEPSTTVATSGAHDLFVIVPIVSENGQ